MTTTDTTALTRRSLLAVGGALCATCAAGCATYGTQSAAPSSAPAPAPSPQAGSPGPQQPAPSGLAAVADIPVGGGKVFADQGVVVTQPRQGTFAAFDATCPHAGCTVNEVVDGAISCPCHGSKFGVADGAPTTGPATSPLGQKQVSVQGDRIVLA